MGGGGGGGASAKGQFNDQTPRANFSSWVPHGIQIFGRRIGNKSFQIGVSKMAGVWCQAGFVQNRDGSRIAGVLAGLLQKDSSRMAVRGGELGGIKPT